MSMIQNDWLEPLKPEFSKAILCGIIQIRKK